jgi:hypothetical protein
MKKVKSKIGITRRNLLIIAAVLLFIAINVFIVSAKAWLHTDFSMPDKVTPEMYRASEEALSAAVFVVIPLMGCLLLATAVGIWLEVRRLYNSESESAEADVNRKS